MNVLYDVSFRKVLEVIVFIIVIIAITKSHGDRMKILDPETSEDRMIKSRMEDMVKDEDNIIVIDRHDMRW